MGYHDRRPPDYNKTGMTIVNPLHKTQNKLVTLFNSGYRRLHWHKLRGDKNESS